MQCGSVIFLYNAEPHKSRSAVNQKIGLSDNAFLTEECRLRLVNKEKADWSSRVPGALLLSRDESRRKNDNKDNIRCEYKG